MLHLGLQIAQDVGSAPGVPDILVLGPRRELVARQSTAHAGRRCFLKTLILKAAGASVHLTRGYWDMPSIRKPVSSTFLTNSTHEIHSSTAMLAGFHLIASR